MNLYEINRQLAAAIEMYDAGVEDVVDTETGEVKSLKDYMSEVQLAFDEKVEGCVLYMKNLKAEEDAIKAEMDALRKRAEAKAKKRTKLEEYVRDICPDKKYEGAKYCLTFRKSESVVAPTKDEELAKLPPEFIRKKIVCSVSADKTAIKKAIKEGFEIPGCHIEIKRNLSY